MWNEYLRKPLTAQEEPGSEQNEKRRRKDLVQELSPLVRNVLKEISPDIEAGNYKVIIGDDASGRLPTFLLSNIIKAAYDERGYKLPQVRFIAGSRLSGAEEGILKKGLMSEYIDSSVLPFFGEEKTDIGEKRKVGKVLIVTDSVLSGKSLDPMVEILRENNIDFDIVSMSGQPDNVSWKDKIILGVENATPPRVYGALENGVYKNADELFARKSSESVEEQRMVATARKKADELSKEIFLDWRKEHPFHKLKTEEI